MALVRKTEKLEKAIVKKLMDTKIDKIQAIFQSLRIDKLMDNFITEAFNAGLIVPEADKEWATGRSQNTYKDYVGFSTVEYRLVVREPFTDNIPGFKILIDEHIGEGPVLPCFITPRMVYQSDDRSVLCAFTCKEDHQSVHGFNKFILCFTIPAMARIEQDGKSGPIYYQQLKNPTELVSLEFFQFVLCMKQYERAIPLNIISHENSKLPHDIIEQFLDFQAFQKQILNAMVRIEKSQMYIFSELWKLPSVNKMREFFPAITAFLPDETINKLNEGASARKKEYNVSLPDKDVIVSATEASIKP